MIHIRKILFLLLLLGADCGVARSDPVNPVNPMVSIDTSSPRSTLLGFLGVMNERYQAMLGPQGIITAYLKSNQLFMDRQAFSAQIRKILKSRKAGARCLDLSHVPSVILDQETWRLMIQLKEILDRTPMPAVEAIPDAAAMQSAPYKKWTLPDSDLTIELIESGPRAGEYLFNQATVDQLPAIYEAIKEEPYLNPGSPGTFEFIFMKPSGLAMVLSGVIPMRWLIEGENWPQHSFMGEPLWRWISLLFLFGIMAAVLWGTFKISRKFSTQGTVSRFPWSLLPALSLLIMIPPAVFAIGELLRLTPKLYATMAVVLWGIHYIAMTWLVWGAANWAAEWLIRFERIRTDDTDSQLIRLGSRLIAILIVTAILIDGANRIGFPSYSIVAGLGIGGLTFALAGQQVFANLLGSLIIMFEKPFRIGHRIKAGPIEGIVENITFRTTRIRTDDGTTLIIPSSEVIHNSIENETLRKHWRVKRSLHLALTTRHDALAHFKTAIAGLLSQNPKVIHKSTIISLQQIALHGLEIEIEFALRTNDEAQQIEWVDAIMMQILELAASQGIELVQEFHAVA